MVPIGQISGPGSCAIRFQGTNDISASLPDETVESSDTKSSKKIYWDIVGAIALKPTAQAKFQSLYPNFEFMWKEIYICPIRITVECKLREFQFKTLHRILYTKKIPHKMKLVESPLCSFCMEYGVSLEHFLHQCKLVKDFWQTVTNWLSTVCDFDTFFFSETDILFGYFVNKKDNTLINHILLLGKQLIYQWRPKRFVLNLALLIAKIKYACKIGERIARSNDKLTKHYKKWERLLPILNSLLSYICY